MRSAVDLQRTVASLRHQAKALVELQRRCAQLRDPREPPHAQLDAVAAAIDDRIEECLRIRGLLAVSGQSERWKNAVAELERQLRRLGVLRSRVLPLYLATVDARTQQGGRQA